MLRFITDSKCNGNSRQSKWHLCIFFVFSAVIVPQYWHTHSLFVSFSVTHIHTLRCPPFSHWLSVIWLPWRSTFFRQKEVDIFTWARWHCLSPPSTHTHLAYRQSPTPHSSRQEGFRNVLHIHTVQISAHTQTHSHGTSRSTACSEEMNSRWH